MCEENRTEAEALRLIKESKSIDDIPQWVVDMVYNEYCDAAIIGHINELEIDDAKKQSEIDRIMSEGGC